MTAEVICPEVTAGRGEVLLRIWAVTSGDPESCPQEAPRARQLLRPAEWYVGIVMMIIGERGDGDDETTADLLRRKERQRPRRLRTATTSAWARLLHTRMSWVGLLRCSSQLGN